MTTVYSMRHSAQYPLYHLQVLYWLNIPVGLLKDRVLEPVGGVLVVIFNTGLHRDELPECHLPLKGVGSKHQRKLQHISMWFGS